MKRDVESLKKIIEAQSELLSCYRLGDSPAAWVIDMLHEAGKVWGSLRKISSQPSIQADAKKLCPCGKNMYLNRYDHWECVNNNCTA